MLDATPVNSKPGDDTVVLPFISAEEAEAMFAAQGGRRKVRRPLERRCSDVARRLPAVAASGFASLDHATRAEQHAAGHDHADGARSSQVDDEVVHVRELDRDVRRLRAAEHAINEFSGAPEQVTDVRSVGQQPSGIGLS